MSSPFPEFFDPLLAATRSLEGKASTLGYTEEDFAYLLDRASRYPSPILSTAERILAIISPEELRTLSDEDVWWLLVWHC